MKLPHDQVLTFLIAGEEYAVSVRHVLEIRPFVSARSLPGTPAWIRGVVERRGAMVPVVDLAPAFGASTILATHRTCVVILETRPEAECLVVGLLVDSVHQVADIAMNSVRPAPALGPCATARAVTGVFEVEGALIVLLDVDRVLLSHEVLAAAALAETAEEATVGSPLAADVA